MVENEKAFNLLHITGFQLKHGDSVEVEGRIKFTAIRFAINLAKGTGNIGLHFNPRFTSGESMIVLNNMVNSTWKVEQVEKSPLERNTNFKVHIKFTKENFEIIVSDVTRMTFPNRCDMDLIEAFWINGDILLKSVKWNISI